ncbi:Rieske domain-containing protein-like isoform X2 [Ostrea edulis]|uniref:Rieske domain-containing protein-like isoform X2 n=1 Tax=Ostrea edulis TaxID=37623 RepID=UPI002094C8F5|nr:Rieske domain-containing protein-like isoform X2 [Ostrea edulis]
MQDDQKIYLPLDVSFQDLYDWSKPEEKYQYLQTAVPFGRSGLRRQNSKTGTLVSCNEQDIAVFRYHNKVYAIKEKCPHLGGPLHLGDIEELPGHTLCVRCPWHSWRFDLDTGQLKQPKLPGVCSIVYPVIVKEDGKLLVGFDQFDPKYFSVDASF